MPMQCDREGTFRGVITEYGVREVESGAVAVSIKALFSQLYCGEEEGWVEWSEYDMEAIGDVWVIKKDNGGVNEKAAKSLIDHAGWDGKFTSINDGTWQPQPCQFTVKAQEWQGNTYYKIAFVNDFNREPGGSLGNVDDTKAKALESQYGSQMRALFSGAKRSATKPTSDKPKSPTAPNQKAAKAAAEANGEEIPF